MTNLQFRTYVVEIIGVEIAYRSHEFDDVDLVHAIWEETYRIEDGAEDHERVAASDLLRWCIAQEWRKAVIIGGGMEIVIPGEEPHIEKLNIKPDHFLDTLDNMRSLTQARFALKILSELESDNES